MSKKKKTCRGCEHFVPRSGMCVHAFSARPGMPLKRRADETCQHHERWRPPSDGVKEHQTADRINAFPAMEEAAKK